MAGPNHFRLTVDMVLKMLHEEQDEEDEEDEEAFLGLDSESEISDAEDLDYALQDQAGVVGCVFEYSSPEWRRLIWRHTV